MDEKMQNDISAIYDAENISIVVERENRRYPSFIDSEVGE